VSALAFPDPFNIGFNVEPVRKCGPCQLCCKLMPIAEMSKPANHRCTHQRHNKGCNIYATRPTSCAKWSCQWLLGTDTADLRRPDLSRYVIDMIPDFVEVEDRETGTRIPVEVVQVWCDPKQRNAWQHDEALGAFLERRASEAKGALIRFSATDAVTVFPPPLSHRFGAPEGDWIVNDSGCAIPERRAAERFDGILRARQTVSP
jgi:hypothetical protein